MQIGDAQLHRHLGRHAARDLEESAVVRHKLLDARMEQRICEYVKRSDQTTSSVETRGELCLAYISHLECQVANQKMALKDKETLSEQIQEVKI